MSDKTVYVAEAYKDGERIERVVHEHYLGAKEDITVLTSLEDPDRIEIEELTVYTADPDPPDVHL